MNLSAYIEALERSAKNLPGVLLDWDSLDEELRAHYSEAMVELLARHQQADREASSAERVQLGRAWSVFMTGVVQHVWAIANFMGFNPLELVAPSSVVVDSFEPASASASSPLAIAA